MPTYDFDQHPDRRASDSIKWNCYDEDILPMWVADMDFVSPEPIVRALHERVEHGIFGYGVVPAGLREAVVDWLAGLYGWQVSPDALLFYPGVVTGFNLVCHALACPGNGVLIQTPVYFPILRAAQGAGMDSHEMELARLPDGRYEIDFDLMERTITDRTCLFLLCNPHNPVGRVFTRGELERIAEICLRRGLTICADEIHSDLVFPGHPHTPIAALDPEVADRTVTLIAPSKTFNVAGLQCSVAIVQNEELRKRLKKTHPGLVHGANVLGYTAAMAGYRDGRPWLDELLGYLQGNVDYLMRRVASDLPGVTVARPEGTYLAWLDCRGAGIAGSPHEFFLKRARVAVNDGAAFGRGGEGFVRLNFGCPRSMLAEALDRMAAALT